MHTRECPGGGNFPRSFVTCLLILLQILFFPDGLATDMQPVTSKPLVKNGNLHKEYGTGPSSFVVHSLSLIIPHPINLDFFENIYVNFGLN